MRSENEPSSEKLAGRQTELISSVTGLSQSNSPEGSASVIATSNCSLEIDTSWRAKRDLAKGAPPSLWEGLRHNELL